MANSGEVVQWFRPQSSGRSGSNRSVFRLVSPSLRSEATPRLHLETSFIPESGITFRIQSPLKASL
jgi:hypothetical protein